MNIQNNDFTCHWWIWWLVRVKTIDGPFDLPLIWYPLLTERQTWKMFLSSSSFLSPPSRHLESSIDSSDPPNKETEVGKHLCFFSTESNLVCETERNPTKKHWAGKSVEHLQERVAVATTGGQSPTTQFPSPTAQRIGFVRFIERAWLSWPLEGWIVFFSPLTFKPDWSGRRKVLLMQNHSLQKQCVRGCRGEGSIIWLYNYTLLCLCLSDPLGTRSHTGLVHPAILFLSMC